MHALAQGKGGKCLSTTYVNARTKLEWECQKGHRWFAVPNSVKQGSWCRKCAGVEKKTIEDMHALAHAREGKCLSTVYVNAQTRLEWECQKGHRWFAIPNSVKQGSWCRKCAGVEKKTIEEIHDLAAQRGGKCLSTEYKDSRTHLVWECALGHQWKATSSNIQRGKWCPKCAGVEKKTIEDMHALAHAREGKCLSTVYVNTKTKLEWECQKGYQWFAVPNSVKQGSWCPHCAGNQLKTLKDMQILASANGGRCLSDTYINSRTKLLWKCRSGHRWWAAPDIIQQGRWCEICHRQKSSRGQSALRSI